MLTCGFALALAGCGFELRRATALPFESVALYGFELRSPLAEALKREFGHSGVVVHDNPARAELVLQALTDGREKSIVASTAAGQVREIQLRTRFRFRASTPSGRELLAPSELLLSRDMSTTETAALAKAQEEAQLYRAMDADIVSQVLRRLAAIKTL